MTLIYNITAILIGFSSGMVISGAVFAFISVIGIVPTMAKKTGTENYIILYEEAIIIGGIMGTVLGVFDLRLPMWSFLAVLFSFSVGIFFGVLAVSLAEVIDVIPVLTRRGKIKNGMFIFICAIAFGKLFGSLMYSCIPGFFKK